MLKIYLLSAAQEDRRVYKIGHTSRDVSDRVKEFRTGNASEIRVEAQFESKWAKKIERALHRHFRARGIGGEWFALEPGHVADFGRICQITHDGLELVERHNTYIIERGGLGRARA